MDSWFIKMLENKKNYYTMSQNCGYFWLTDLATPSFRYTPR